MFEELEQIPWSELVKPQKRPGPWALAAVGLALVVVVVLVATRSRPVAAPVIDSSTTTTAAAASFDVGPTEEPALLTEADLRAGESHELLVLGTAVIHVRSVSRDDHYVEWAVAEALTNLGRDLWSVEVAYQPLVPGGAGPTRLPVRRVLVPIRVTGHVAGLAGPLTPIRAETAPATDVWGIGPGVPPHDVEQAALEAFAQWGDDVVLGDAGRADDLWRVEAVVDGITMAVWIGPDGQIDGLPLP